jgi:uncharacterized protein DUF1286
LKALTHDIFSLGVALYLLHVERPTALPDLLLVVWLAFASNELIDALGHVTRRGVPARSSWTHSVFTAPAWGVAAGVLSARTLDLITGQAFSASQALLAIELGAVIGFSHLLLDALTEGGVFLRGRRVALAHMRYDNPVLNGAFSALGLLLALAAFS